MIDPLYTVKCTCLMCGNEYHTSKVRPSFKKPYKRDTDFCLHYQETNPEFYVDSNMIRACREQWALVREEIQAVHQEQKDKASSL